MHYNNKLGENILKPFIWGNILATDSNEKKKENKTYHIL